MVKRSIKRQTQPGKLAGWQQLISKYPLAFWGGLWLVLLVIGAMATRGLLSPGSIVQDRRQWVSSAYVEQEQPANHLVATTSNPTPNSLRGFTQVPKDPPPETGVPLWLYSAIALSCATGAVLILLGFFHKPRKILKRVKTSSHRTRTVKIRKNRQHNPPHRRPLLSNTRQQPPLPTAPSLLASPLVSVVPPEQSHPLDGGPESLADIMDLRKRQSLGSLLR